MEDTRTYNTLTRVREIEEHLDLMNQDNVGPIERDERLDCALEAARLEFLVALDETYTPTREELERAVGMPFVYVEVAQTWYALPLGFVEIERPVGYALAPVLPNTRQLSELLANCVDREAFAREIVADHEMRVLIVHALSAPTVFGLTRVEVLVALEEQARTANASSLERLGDWARAVTAVTLVEMRAQKVHSTLEATH